MLFIIIIILYYKMTKYSIKVPKIENNTHYFSKIMGIKTSKPNLKTNTTRA